MADRLLLRGGYVVTMDEQLGDIPGGDVLVEGDTIVQVGRDLAAADAEVIDARGKVVIPGFIDTHRHTWETRSAAARRTPPWTTTSSRCSTRSRRSTAPKMSTPAT